MTRTHLVTALLLTGCAFLISLVFNPLSIPSLTEAEQGAKTENQEAQTRDVRYVTLSGRHIRVDIADTPEKREQGLSGRVGLLPDEGMLFVFPQDNVHSFWMKDMYFPIDILWISSEGIIVDMRERVSPETYPTVFTPSIEARYVLELPEGWVETYAVELGDEVRL